MKVELVQLIYYLINVDKLKKEGFIWEFYNFNKVLKKVRN